MKSEILIVSDDIIGCPIYRNTLEAKGYATSHRSTIQDAIQHVKNKNVNVIIIDMDVPKTRRSDLKIVKRLKEMNFNNIILVVGDISDLALDDCLEEYNINVIRKPYKIEDLLSDVDTFLNN